ncbi:hypothetical protein EW026_g4673 [Hermanssonia centrifuga]|uniref:Uncharacterized protein n=1 Tax=Hermanssonia centrifuga TaxID=98765 RepID=A0A4S4KGE2_9APHY|nr:hypothetical protein EW026_g4673 [Hermanssonia centrifuga]
MPSSQYQVRDLYRERVSLEREYAGKLLTLAKKAADRKSKKIAPLVLGNEPTKAWDENVVKESTLDKAYSQLIASFEDSAQDHLLIADGLSSQVVDALKATEKRHEEAKKRQMQYFQKLLSDRDKAYADRLKAKQKYDEECAEVDLYRQKQVYFSYELSGALLNGLYMKERSTDDRHADRAAKQYEQQQVDMLNSKNVYVISTAVANSTKTKFYEEDLPTLEDQFQDLHSQLLERFANIIVHAQDLHGTHLENLKSRVSATEQAFKELDPYRDQELFIDYNISHFSAPADWAFEPCATHYDTNYLEAQHQLTFFITSECMLTAEVQTIVAALGASTESSPVTPTPSSFAQPDISSALHEDTYPLARVIFDFIPTSPFELAVTEGASVQVLEEDDGSGWVKVTDEDGVKGLVPASYVTLVDPATTHSELTPSAPLASGHPHGSGIYVRGVYDYQAQGPDELGMREGELIELTGGSSGRPELRRRLVGRPGYDGKEGNISKQLCGTRPMMRV